jgi:hypothetical protein
MKDREGKVACVGFRETQTCHSTFMSVHCRFHGNWKFRIMLWQSMMSVRG